MNTFVSVHSLTHFGVFIWLFYSRFNEYIQQNVKNKIVFLTQLYISLSIFLYSAVDLHARGDTIENISVLQPKRFKQDLAVQ